MTTTIEKIEKLTATDFPAFACLLDLLSEHQAIAENNTLAGGVDALKCAFIHLWDAAEAAISESR